MSHEIRETDSLMYVGEKPWHGIGNAIPAGTVLTAFDAMVAAGLNWDVYQRPAYFDGMGDVKTPIVTEEGQMKVNCRLIEKDGQTLEQALGAVGPRYTIIQNAAAFEWFDPFVQAGEATYNTAGSLKDGKIVWVLAELNREPAIITQNDTIRKFLLLTHSHDGSRAVQVGFTPIRVVCWNTLSMATCNESAKEASKTTNQMLRLKHTKKVMEALSAVRETVNAADARFEATAEVYRKLASFPISKSDLERYVTVVLSSGSPGADPTDPSTKMANMVNAILTNVATMKGGFDGTVWGAYNLMTEYLTWTRGREKENATKAADNRLSDLWLGGMSAKMGVIALDEAIKLAV